MRFAFTDDQLLFRDAARDVLRGECSGNHVRGAWESEDGRVPGLWARLAEVGVVGMTAAERWGGMELGELELVLVLEESGVVALPEPIVETTAVGIPLLQDIGSDALKDRWLGAAAAGKATFAVGLRSGLVAGARGAGLLLLSRDDGLYALEPANANVLHRRESVDGARHLYEVGWSVGDAELIAEGESARRAIETACNRGALAAAAQLLGLGQRMIEMTVEHATNRKQFGRPIGSFQAVKHQLADAHVALELARPVVYRAAYSMAHGDVRSSLHVSMAKAFASDAAYKASRAALQCHGAIGYSYEYDLHLWMKRTWALAKAWGDADWHRARVSDNLLLGDQ
jgi:alkylation response protein AidB-like acyl-CoA dehydrogenase